MQKEKIWGLLVNLGIWQGGEDEKSGTFKFEQSAWEDILDQCQDAGINTIVLDCGGAIDFPSHPEITMEGAWSLEKLKEEIERCRAKGIRIIPKLNFSAQHDNWLGEYNWMLCTSIYYKVCKDLIKDAYEAFEHPEFIHIGMDEEDEKHASVLKDVVTWRKPEKHISDVKYLIDCVTETGAKAWIWPEPLFYQTELYEKSIAPDEAIVSPATYNAIYKEHWTPITSRQEYIDYYNKPPYKDMNLTYVEEEPYFDNFREKALPLLEHGYTYVPIMSPYNKCDISIDDVFRYFKENAPDEQIRGYMMTIWWFMTEERKHYYEHGIKLFKDAKEKYYG